MFSKAYGSSTTYVFLTWWLFIYTDKLTHIAFSNIGLHISSGINYDWIKFIIYLGGLMALLSASLGFSSSTGFGGSFLLHGTDSSAETEAWTSALTSLAESAEFEVT